jgi:hypothetical protein
MNKEKTRMMATEFGDIEVTTFLLNHWTRYGWPCEQTLDKMARNYRLYHLPDGAVPEEAQHDRH